MLLSLGVPVFVLECYFKNVIHKQDLTKKVFYKLYVESCLSDKSFRRFETP